MSNALCAESAASSDLLSVVLNHVGEAIFVKDRSHRFVWLNEACCKLLGVEQGSLVGRTDLDLPPELDLHGGGDELLFETGEEQAGELTLTDAKGRLRSVSIRRTLYRDTDDTPFLVGVLRDVTERKQAVKLLLHQALHDRMTGLGNRSLFERYLQRAIDGARRHGKGLAVICLDVDHFSVVNDTLGHQAGDSLLIAVARRLRSVLRPRDPVARLSGDEFACLLAHCEDPPTALRIAERIHESFRQPFQVGNTEAHLTVSIGIAWSSPEESSQDLLRFAGVALRRAKRKGAGSQLFEAAIDGAATERLHLQNDLRRALRKREFVLHYQPVMDMESGQVAGVEALVRWLHPTRGLIPPDRFIPLAEETGLIVPLGDWVLHEACRQAVRWKQKLGLASSFTVSVNLSAKQVRDRRLASRAQEILDETGLPPNELILELTENVLLEETARARELCEVGVRLAIDDFGTGYASLAYLRDLPVSMLKIARPFISKLGVDVVDTSLVNTILTLVQDLGLIGVAEGIEEPKQATLLRQMRCQLAQGFLFAKPMPAATAEEFLTRNGCRSAPALLRLVPMAEEELAWQESA